MEASGEALITRLTINQMLGQVSLDVPLSPYDLSLDAAGRYLYIPDGTERQLIVFHATEEEQGDITLDSQEARHALGWRKCAAGAGLYGGNTPFAASASMVDAENPRQIRMYATEAVSTDDISVPHGAGYLGKMIRNQFDKRHAEEQVRARTAEASPVELLEPGLVSATLRDVHVSMPDAHVLKPRWIKISALPEAEDTQTLRYLGTLQEQPIIQKGFANRLRFWSKVGARIGERALSGATSRG